MSEPAVVVLRPRPGFEATFAAAMDRGLAATGAPLFTAEPQAWTCPDPADLDALLVASANVFRHGGETLARLRALPVHAVGRATAAAARAAGFAVATVGSRDIAALVAGLPRPARLLRLAGAEHVAISPPDGLSMTTRVVYAARPLPLAPELLPQLRRGAVVLLHSAAAAARFATECERLEIPRAPLALACLSSRAAAAAGSGWASVRSATEPNDPALLALAEQMCQSAGSKGEKQPSADGS